MPDGHRIVAEGVYGTEYCALADLPACVREHPDALVEMLVPAEPLPVVDLPEPSGMLVAGLVLVAWLKRSRAR